ncbi:MAG: hypothetical protein ABIG39_05030, partial [Candidatus Micrarchaeota archaeon]
EIKRRNIIKGNLMILQELHKGVSRTKVKQIITSKGWPTSAVDDGSFDMYYVESCTFVRKDGVKPEPVPLCPPGCKRVGTTCACPVQGVESIAGEMQPEPMIYQVRELSAEELNTPSTRVSILNYELQHADATVKGMLLEALQSDDAGASEEANGIVDSHVEYVLDETQGKQVRIVNIKNSLIKKLSVKEGPDKELSVNVVRRKMIERERIRKMLTDKMNVDEIMGEIESTGVGKIIGGVVVDGKGYSLLPSQGDELKGTLVTSENGVSKEVGEIDIETGEWTVRGAIRIYSTLLEIVS